MMDCIDFSFDDNFIGVKDLKKGYEKYCRKNRLKPEKTRECAEKIETKGAMKVKRVKGGDYVWIYENIKWKEQ